MDKSQPTPEKGRKESRHEFLNYVEEIKSRVDIFQIAAAHGLTVNKYGQADCFNGHDSKTPSLTFYEDSQTYHCFGCGAHGDVITLVQQIDQCSFTEAMNRLAQETGIKPYQSNNGFDPEVYARVSDCLRVASEIYHGWLTSDDAYLEQRGISYGTAQQFLIGRTRGKEDMRHALGAKGVTADIMLQSGLVKTDGDDFFQNHIVVPIMRCGRVVDFYGRALNGNDERRHWRLPNDRYQVGHGLFNWNPRAEEIILVEGVFDALALIQNGFMNAIAVLGTNGLNEQALRMISGSRAHRVLVCYDGEPAAQQAALKHAHLIQDSGKDVRLVQLPDSQDPCEYASTHSGKDFQQLLDQALSPLDYELAGLSSEVSLEAKVKALRSGILSRCRSMSPLDQAITIKKIAKTIGLRERDVRGEIEAEVHRREEPVADVELVDPSHYQKVHPALHISEENALITVPVLVRRQDSGELRWQPYVVTSGREMFPLTREELMERGYYCKDLVFVEKPRYRWDVIEGFLSGQRQGNLRLVHARIRDMLKDYVDLSDPNTYDYLACYAIATYFHPIFNYFPYLHFTGTKAVGKSKTLKILYCLCFNAILSVDLSDASQYRSIEALRPTLILDETENLHERGYSERRALLLGGYEDGPSVLRTEQDGDAYRVREFENFGPRVFASIEGLESTLASRTVQIPMRRSYDDSIKQREVDRKDAVWEEMRSELFLILMGEAGRIRDLYHTLAKPDALEFDSREYNLFKPVLTVGMATGDEKVVKALIDFSNNAYRRKTDHYNDSADENILLRALLEIVTRDDWYSSELLKEQVIAFVNENGLQMEQALTRNRLGTLMTNMGIYADKTRKAMDNKKVTLYRVERGTLLSIAENYEVDRLDRPGQTPEKGGMSRLTH